MPRRSNTTARVVAVMEFLAGHTGEALGLSELSRELGINKATLLSIISTLLDDGWLLQHPTTRCYSLGPTLIGAGSAALGRFPDTGPIRPLMDRFAAGYDVGCVAVAVAEGQLVVLSRSGFGDPLHGLARSGVRMPFAPPFGLALSAWYPPGRFDAWMAAANPPVGPEEMPGLLGDVATARDRGFVVGLDLPPDHELAQQLRAQRLETAGISTELLVHLGQALRRHGYHLDDIRPAASYRVNHISVPILGPQGGPEIALMVPLHHGKQTGDRLVELGTGLVALAQEAARVAPGAGAGARQDDTKPR
ncbi:helix-turn-helix domain-containing protein [Dactylosporangium sucinum]|uniref:Transcriptional regulator n=1 Tax=Dactylosporangium sucinum TaxID=1424081 RepID=A0A917TUX3_9ACTN|nr:helix-turn-helix domain-containing protein [Dactylosporangium sucinum]GGM38922.1 transcriptional regulator [Dactylosporangium sucinum]